MVPEDVRDIDGFDELEGDLSRELNIFVADEMRDFFEANDFTGDFAGRLDFRGAKLFGDTVPGSTDSADVLHISGARVALSSSSSLTRLSSFVLSDSARLFSVGSCSLIADAAI
jgi:hypothetical protein